MAEPFQENVYIIWQENSNERFLIDSGSDPEKFINVVDPYRLQPNSIINIYAHLNHSLIKIIKVMSGDFILYPVHGNDTTLLQK